MKIHFIQPFDVNSPPNIGGAINAAIEQLNPAPEDWIANTDYDLLWLLPSSKKQLSEILLSTEFKILAPRMNRLGNDYQLIPGMFDLTNIQGHIEVAEYLSDAHWGEVKSFTGGPLAAACLCFQYRTWVALGGFDENSLAFDTQFCIRAERSGMKMGIMEGIYCFHTYRLSKQVNNIDHLL